MSTTLPASVAIDLIANTPGLSDATADAMQYAGIGRHHESHERAVQCAAYLYTSGWMHIQEQALCGGESDRKILKRAKKEARHQLIACGAIPPSLIWWFVHFAFRVYIERLVQRWLFGSTTTQKPHQNDA